MGNESHFNVSLTRGSTSHNSVHKQQLFKTLFSLNRRIEPRRSSIHQPSALPPGHLSRSLTTVAPAHSKFEGIPLPPPFFSSFFFFFLFFPHNVSHVSFIQRPRKLQILDSLLIRGFFFWRQVYYFSLHNTFQISHERRLGLQEENFSKPKSFKQKHLSQLNLMLEVNIIHGSVRH